MTSYQTKPATGSGIVATAKNAVWTVYYFVYFLFTGQPEWKCESHQPQPLIACCDAEKKDHSQANFKWSAEPTFRSNGHAAVHQKEGFFSRVWRQVKNAAQISCNYAKRIGKFLWSTSISVLSVIWSFISWLWGYLNRAWNRLKSLGSSRQAKSFPASTFAPKPFSPDSPSFNKVEFNPEDKFFAFKENLEATVNSQLRDGQQSATENNQSGGGNTFGAWEIEQEEEVGQRTLREPSIPPPPPPPPQKPVRIEKSVEPEERERRQEQREPKEMKGGIPHLSKEVLAELTGTLRGDRSERGPSAQRELTQSCHPDMDEWKGERFDKFEKFDRYDRSGTATRASSVGPSMRKLEHFVSRLDDSSDNEAQFVFRPPTRDAKYQMGKSVFSPVDEAERMREAINRDQPYGSRAVTPSSYYTERRYGGANDAELRQRAKTVEPVRAFTPSFAYSNAPFTSHTARRSKTPVAFDRSGNFAYDRDDVTNGVVNNTARCWPPASNATGAPVEKDFWVNNVLGQSDDGLITTMCRRVVEKKTQDNWKWRDDAGALVDEKNQRSWKGELDTVVRDGPNQGRQWSRTVEQKPNGVTLFQDVSRQYDRNYVVESVVRNY